MSGKLRDEIEDFRAKISNIVYTLEDISTSSKSIPDTSVENLSNKFEGLNDGLDNAKAQLQSTLDLLDDLRRQWG
ncbi:MAG: hypothetical protein O4861_06130 [Trichodesmium sp. St16_bin4-tuft]|nr:hypothetical protein [Trichodesmium sp. MAG_R01]MDE5097936.1 hypothetical protein [Trichodesmium sp. St16_bin4-tuft]